MKLKEPDTEVLLRVLDECHQDYRQTFFNSIVQGARVRGYARALMNNGWLENSALMESLRKNEVAFGRKKEDEK
jgi:hypothetical protein